MGKIFILCEKFSQSKELAKALTHRGKYVKEGNTGFYEDDKFIISNCVGHLYQAKMPKALDPRFETWNLDNLPFKFEKLEFEPKESTLEQLHLIESLFQRDDIDEIAVSSDPDREGELLARIVLNELKPHVNKYSRIWLESLSSEEAIKKAFDERLELGKYDNLYLSAVARQFADYHVGLNGTMAMSSKLKNKYSLGRVQTPTLNMVVNREKEIKRFVTDTFYKIKAYGENIVFDYISADEEEGFFSSKEEANKVISQIGVGLAIISKKNESEKKEYPKKLFSLSDLQIEMNKKYGYKAQQVLDICQALYEKYKITTYPRTDENYITEATFGQINKIIDTLPCIFDQQVNFIKLNNRTINKSCIAKKEIGSHEALQPVVANKKISDEVIKSLKEDELNVYKAIIERFLSNFYDPAIFVEQKVIISKNNYNFKYSTKTLKEKGYLNSLFDEDDFENKPFISKNEGEFIEINKLVPESFKTKPKERFSEGTLIKAMKNPISYLNDGTKEIYQEAIKRCGGIGTEATRGQIIEDLKKREFIEVKGKSLYATAKGIELIEILPSEKLKSIELTSTFEQNLEFIKDGEYSIENFKNNIYELVQEIVDEMKNISQENINNAKQNTMMNNSICECPNCNGLIIKGQYGFFCSNKCGVNLTANALERFGKKKPISDKEAIDILTNFPTKKYFSFVSIKSNNPYEAKIKYEFCPNEKFKNKLNLIFKERKELEKDKKQKLLEKR